MLSVNEYHRPIDRFRIALLFVCLFFNYKTFNCLQDVYFLLHIPRFTESDIRQWTIWKQDLKSTIELHKRQIEKLQKIQLVCNIWASLWENRSSGFQTRSDTNRIVQSLNMARGLKFRIKQVEGLYYPYGENKCADQLRGNREADLRLCFRICKMPVFSRRGSFIFL